jgi:RimJ/RimL family protein N-acetyltransferase
MTSLTSKNSNSLGQRIGFPVELWEPSTHPQGSVMEGHLCQLVPIDVQRHSQDLFNAFQMDKSHHNWTYLPYGPFEQYEDFKLWLEAVSNNGDPYFFSVIDRSNAKAVGVASYLRITPTVGVIEVGHIHFSPLMQGSTLATEAMFLMMSNIFDCLGYRRYEWKCDSLNKPSCRAAQRLGFTFEGIFRQATLYKRRNRDTAWYSILDTEWSVIKNVFENWLNSDNFDDQGNQKTSLSVIMKTALKVTD